MNPTILMAISKWAVKNLGVGESLKEVGTETLQEYVWNPLKEKISKHFSSKEETQQFIEQLSLTEAKNEKKPQRDVEDLYEELKGEVPDNNLFHAIAEFFRDNQTLVSQLNVTNDDAFNKMFVYQNAETIYNNKGVQNFTINFEKK